MNKRVYHEWDRAKIIAILRELPANQLRTTTAPANVVSAAMREFGGWADAVSAAGRVLPPRGKRGKGRVWTAHRALVALLPYIDAEKGAVPLTARNAAERFYGGIGPAKRALRQKLRNCAVCGKPYVQGNVNQRHCSDTCRSYAYRARRAAAAVRTDTRICVKCGRPWTEPDRTKRGKPAYCARCQTYFRERYESGR